MREEIRCPGCGNALRPHYLVRRLYRCGNPICSAYDRWVTPRAEKTHVVSKQ